MSKVGVSEIDAVFCVRKVRRGLRRETVREPAAAGGGDAPATHPAGGLKNDQIDAARLLADCKC
jgi:hypothetical protein